MKEIVYFVIDGKIKPHKCHSIDAKEHVVNGAFTTEDAAAASIEESKPKKAARKAKVKVEDKVEGAE